MDEDRKEDLWMILHAYKLLFSGQPNVSSSNDAMDACIEIAGLAIEGIAEFRQDAINELR